MIVGLIFGIFAICLMLGTLIEIVASGGFNGALMDSTFPWLIFGWCLWLILFYTIRKWRRKWEEGDDGR